MEIGGCLDMMFSHHFVTLQYADMGYDSFFRFDSSQSQKVLIVAQLMTHNGFQKWIQINSRLKMVLWNLIQIDS